MSEHVMHPDYLQVGDPVQQSPVGPGVITDITEAGYPQVNHVAVAILQRTDGRWWNPHNFNIEEVCAQWAEVDKKLADKK